jgi:hypothetical protein
MYSRFPEYPDAITGIPWNIASAIVYPKPSAPRSGYLKRFTDARVRARSSAKS